VTAADPTRGRARPRVAGRDRAWRRIGLVQLVVLAVVGVAGSACRRPVVSSPVEAAVQRMPRNAARFEIRATDDSTVTFARDEARWIAAGQEGIAVDPLRRDVLVARLRVLTVAPDGDVRALVTGQTTRVTDAHVVLLAVPEAPLWRRRTFWLGAAGGGVAGLLGGLLLR
jgi:hypothetical protein